MGAADFARVDIRNPLVARVIEAAGVDTVVHASASSTPASSAARSMAKEMNVLGTMQLLAACQRSESVRNLIVRSTGAVYGASSRDPAIFTEDMSARSVPSSGPGRDAIDIEAYVRGFGRRRPDVRIAVPRFADIIGPTVVTPLTRYFALSPVVPMVLGRDARLQLVHEHGCRRSDGTPCGGRLLGHGQRRRGRRDHPCAGHPPGRPGAARRARRSPWTGCPGRCARCGLGGFSPARSNCCRPAGCWTPPGCCERAGYTPGSPPSRRSTISRPTLRPALAPVDGAAAWRSGSRRVGPRRAGRCPTVPRRRPEQSHAAGSATVRSTPEVTRSGPIPVADPIAADELGDHRRAADRPPAAGRHHR